MKPMSPRWCGGCFPGLLLALALACSNAEQPPGSPDGGTGPDGGTASRKPYVVFVVDRSFSIISPFDPSKSACLLADQTLCGTQGVDNCDPSRCPTRLRTVQSQLETFMANHPSQARYGLAFFPATAAGASTPVEACRAPTEMTVPPPSSDEPLPLQRSEEAVLEAIRNVPTPAGSTPLSATLAMVAQAIPLDSSAAMNGDAVVVITDGLPNCNPNNPHDGILDPAGCRCTVTTCSPSSVSRIGCLDQDASMVSVNSLRERGVRTFFMPVGSDAMAGGGSGVFSMLSEAGTTTRPCTTNTECGAFDCDPFTHLCSRPPLQLGELDRVLAP